MQSVDLRVYVETLYMGVPLCNLIQRHFTIISCTHYVGYFMLKYLTLRNPNKTSSTSITLPSLRGSQTVFTACSSRVDCHQAIPGKKKKKNLLLSIIHLKKILYNLKWTHWYEDVRTGAVNDNCLFLFICCEVLMQHISAHVRVGVIGLTGYKEKCTYYPPFYTVHVYGLRSPSYINDNSAYLLCGAESFLRS
jgi:hypothetical protein